MDFISDKTIDITTLAMDGLMKRHKVLSANVANAEVEGFKRQDVSFEDKLKEILSLEEDQERLKVANSHMTSAGASAFVGAANLSSQATSKAIEAQRAYGAYNPALIGDDSPAISENGNNVNIEKEMVEMAKNSSRFMVLSELQSRMMKHTTEIIKGAI